MNTLLEGFLQMWLGVPNVGDTSENRGQCVGLIEKWLDLHGCAHIWGNAKDLLKSADLKVYRVIYNNPVNFPASGDIAVWNANWGNGNGHTAVVLVANAHFLVAFEQNNPAGSAPTVMTHGYADVLGWISLPGSK